MTNEIKEKLLFHTQLLQELVGRQRGKNRERVGQLPPNCNLPLKTYTEVLKVEQQLKSKEFYSSIVNNQFTIIKLIFINNWYCHCLDYARKTMRHK